MLFGSIPKTLALFEYLHWAQYRIVHSSDLQVAEDICGRLILSLCLAACRKVIIDVYLIIHNCFLLTDYGSRAILEGLGGQGQLAADLCPGVQRNKEGRSLDGPKPRIKIEDKQEAKAALVRIVPGILAPFGRSNCHCRAI